MKTQLQFSNKNNNWHITRKKIKHYGIQLKILDMQRSRKIFHNKEKKYQNQTQMTQMMKLGDENRKQLL